jgi:hypothetical protein
MHELKLVQAIQCLFSVFPRGSSYLSSPFVVAADCVSVVTHSGLAAYQYICQRIPNGSILLACGSCEPTISLKTAMNQ